MLRRSLRALEKLVIVESPNKVIKVEGLLSDPKVIPDWSFHNSKLRAISTGTEKAIAMATTGHFMALKELTWVPQGAGPSASGGGAEADDFPPNGLLASFSLEWELIPGRRIQDTISHYIEEKADNLSEIIVATDPDREGELIAVHAQNLIRRMFPQLNVPFTRAYMHSITAEGIRRAMEERHEAFDYDLANAAEARHAMDRIFGFLGSSVVRYANPQMRSIGRVQTPALILINDRETKIKAYLDSHASTFEVQAMCNFASKRNERFSQVVKVTPTRPSNGAGAGAADSGDKAAIKARCDAWSLAGASDFRIAADVKPQESTTPPPKPFTMATLISRANRQLHYSSDMVSSCLQDLFQMGFITYPRTDSTRIDESVLPSIYAAVRREHGARVLQESEGAGTPATRRTAKAAADAEARGGGGGNVEDAHEAIRPTNIDTTVEGLGSVSSSMKQIYDLVRRNTLAAHMIAMRTERVALPVTCRASNGEEVQFELQGKHVVEPGWSAAFRSGKGAAATTDGATTEQDAQAVEEGAAVVPSISDDEFRAILDLAATRGAKRPDLRLSAAQVVENRPSPPLPFSEGGLIEQLKNNGVGRPSTYPMIVKTLLARNYITVNQGRCETTPVGRMLVDTSRATFPSIVDIGFTSAFEKKLDAIAKPELARAWTLPPNVSDADYVLSSFISSFLNYVTEATKAQRATITTRSLTLQHEKSGSSSSGASSAPSSFSSPSQAESFAATLERETKRVMSMVPSLVDNMKSYRTFTALQNSLNDYLRRNFPPSAMPTAAASSPVSNATHRRSYSSSTKYPTRASYTSSAKTAKQTPRRAPAKTAAKKKK